ncbi:ABC transporter ATP-binding protein [Halobacteriales archaeon QS_8_69_26]|nr:MAG: ABC transporter ATP-binding protein [Halobacteriales archaeon QS_8_69_26]
MVEIHLEGVTKRYGTATAMRDVTFTAREGEFFTLVGPSGCGKTTTLRTIAGFESPTEGSIRFGDREMTGVPPEDRDVGIVFQSYALFPHMSVAENVGYGLRFRDPPGGQDRGERIAAMLDLVDLGVLGDRDPDQLSGGQRQRVALARALAPGPEVLLLDEPMSALDARLRESLRRQVKAIQSELSITTVYVTHDQEEALAVSDRVAVMSDGRVEQVGRPREVYRRPATRFVATFVGENNCFEGRVARVDDDAVTVAGEDFAFLVATPGGNPTEGDPATVCVRPENLVSVEGTTGDPSETTPTEGEESPIDAETEGSPTDVPSAESPTGPHNRIDLDVTRWEFLGEAVRVWGDWRGREVVVRTREVPEADRIAVAFDPADAHLL